MTSLHPHRLHNALLALMAVGLCTAAMPASAQPLTALRYAPDVTIGLGATLVGGGVLAADDLGGTVALVDIANLPPAARIADAHR